MNFKEIKSKFLLYLQDKLTSEGDNAIPADLSAKSIFLYQDDFKNFLKDECNINDSSLLSMSVTDILKMNVSEENDAETYGADESEEMPDQNEAMSEEGNNNSWLSEFMDELFKDKDFKNSVDADKNGKIGETELNNFLDKIKDLDGNSDSVSLDDLFKTYEAVNNGTIGDITGNKETEETAEDKAAEAPAADTATANDSQSPASSGTSSNYNNPGNTNVSGDNTGTENNGPKTLDNMSEEELNSEKDAAKSELDKNQAALQAINDGSNSELSELDKEVAKAYDEYKESLSPEMAEELERITSAISKVENEISQKESEISQQTSVVANAKTNSENAQATYEAMDAAVKALEAQSNSSSDEEGSSDLNKKISDAKARRERAKTDAEKAKKDYEKEKDKLEKLEKEEEELKTGENGLDKLNKEKQEFEAQIDENSDSGKLMAKYNEAKAKYTSTKSELQTKAKTDVETSQKRLDEVNTALNNYKNKKEVSDNYSSTAGLFSSNVKMTRQMITDEKTGQSYYLMAPEGVDPTKDELPLMVYLHGGSQATSNFKALESGYSSPGTFLKDTNFRGYILCPTLAGGNNDWSNEKAVNNLDSLLESFCSSHKVNKNQIALAGVSLGGSGTVYMSNSKLKKWFRKAAAISPARGQIDTSSSKIPLKLFFGSNDDPRMFNYINNELSKYNDLDITYVGNRNVKNEQVTHTWAAAKSFGIDSNNNGRSDLIEWLFS